MSFIKTPLIFCLLLWHCVVFSAIESLSFENESQQKTYQTLVNELRCLVCQNNNLADSNAALAKDLRHKVYNMVTEGKTREDVIDYMIARYGDFVLYKPRFKGFKMILWILPFILLALGFILLIRFIRHQKKPTQVPIELDHHRAQQLLSNNEAK